MMPAKKIQDFSERGSISLRVTEALPKDVGRGVARIDPEEIEKLGLSVGDIVVLQGKRETGAKLLPAFSDQRGKGLIQIDGILRANAKVGIDEKLKVTAVTAQPAQSV